MYTSSKHASMNLSNCGDQDAWPLVHKLHTCLCFYILALIHNGLDEPPPSAVRSDWHAASRVDQSPLRGRQSKPSAPSHFHSSAG